jgi:hypothetical protein
MNDAPRRREGGMTDDGHDDRNARAPAMTAAELRAIGIGIAAAYGRDIWIAPLARLLGCTGRTLARWVSGHRPVPDDIAATLRPFAHLACPDDDDRD